MKIIKYQLNELGNELINVIKSRSDIFQPINIIVPNKKTSEWFKAYWLKTQDNVLMNVKFQLINEALTDFIENDQYCRLLNKEELRTLIIKAIVEIEGNKLPIEITNYIYDNEQINEIKLYDLSCELAKLFVEYEKELVDVTSWQKEIYETVLNEALEHNLSSLRYIYEKNQKFKKITTPIYFFGFIRFSLLEEKIIKEFSQENEVVLLMLEQDTSYNQKYEVIAAPSKFREIEAIHSKICNLLLDDNNTYEDFLVVSKNISEYEEIIPRVFKQDNIEYPNIPYVINDYKRRETNISVGLKTLIEIANKAFFTRLDFYNLINNQDIQIARGISLNDVECWSRYLVDINAYRNSDLRDDWDYAKKRILLSKVSGVNDIDNNIVEIQNKEYLPFSTIEFDDESIVKFVSIIDDLKEWLNITNKINYINNDNLQLIINQLEKWFSCKDINDFETNQYYKNIKKNLAFWDSLSIPENKIPRNTLFYSLIDGSNVGIIRTGEYFTKGVTFSDFSEEAVLSTKYVFFLNASSNNLPTITVKSELDQREYDIDNALIEENAFLIQYQNCEKFFVSFVNKDLKTDEEFYPSTFILKLKNRLDINVEEISLDETRNWNELYTKNETINKNYYNDLLKLNDEIHAKSTVLENELVKKVRLNDLARFLEEPFENKVKHLFGSDDDLDEQIKDEYEPLKIDNITRSVLIRKICVDLLSRKENQIDINYFMNIKKRFDLEHKLPDITSDLNEFSINEVLEDCKKIIQNIISKTNFDYEIYKTSDVILNIDSNQIILTCSGECCVNETTDQLTYFYIKNYNSKVKINQFLYPYVFALADISQKAEKEYDVVLDVQEIKRFKMTPSKAKELLTKMYLLKFDYEHNYVIPIELVSQNKIKSFSELVYRISSGEIWRYFKQKQILDYDKHLGFTSENYDLIAKKIYDEHKALIAFLDKGDQDEE